jgi:hypothetical protein
VHVFGEFRDMTAARANLITLLEVASSEPETVMAALNSYLELAVGLVRDASDYTAAAPPPPPNPDTPSSGGGAAADGTATPATAPVSAGVTQPLDVAATTDDGLPKPRPGLRCVTTIHFLRTCT